jgi:hypothetical protein
MCVNRKFPAIPISQTINRIIPENTWEVQGRLNEGGIQDGFRGFANPVTVEINFRPMSAKEEREFNDV